jgi:anti-sigma factor RsiW
LDCETARTLINAYVDGELDLAAGLALERHIQGCPACTRAYRRQIALHAALAGAATAGAAANAATDAGPAASAPTAGAPLPDNASPLDPDTARWNGNASHNGAFASREAGANEAGVDGEPARSSLPANAAGAGALYYHAPAGLQGRLQASLRRAERTGAAGSDFRPPAALRWNPLRLGGALVALIALIAFVGVAAWALAGRESGLERTNLVAQEVIAGHMRSLMADHLTDVTSTDQHTVKPWYAGKLDFSPPVEDLAGQGYPLAGGRLDYVAGRPVAALVYRRNQHVINLFIWPDAPGAQISLQGSVYQGDNLLHWDQAGMTFWAVSDLNPGELHQFVGLLQAAIAAAPAP